MSNKKINYEQYSNTILKLLHLGFPGKKIAKKIGFSPRTAYRMINKLIENGMITKEEIALAKENNREEIDTEQNKSVKSDRSLEKKNRMPLGEQMQFVLERREKGWSSVEIKNDSNGALSEGMVERIIKKLVQEKLISQEEMENAIRKHKQELLEERHKEIIKQIKEYTRQGISFKEMEDKIGYHEDVLKRIKREYEKKHGWFSEDEIKRFKRARQNEEELESKSEDEYEKIQDKMIEQIKEFTVFGYNIEEIASFLGYRKTTIEKMISQNIQNHKWFSQKEIKEFRKVREERFKKTGFTFEGLDDRETQIMKQIIEFTMQGIPTSEMQNYMLPNKKYLERIKQEYIKGHGWFSPQELKDFLKIRIYEKDREKISEYARQGLLNKEIANKMYYGLDAINARIKIYKQQGLWFSDEDILKFRRQRRIREKKEKNKFQKKEKERLAPILKLYRQAKSAALKEEKLIYDRNQNNVTTNGRERFLSVIAATYDAGAIISSDDCSFVFRLIHDFPHLVTHMHLKMLIMNCFENNGLRQTEQMINELCDIVRGTKYHNYLVEFKRYISIKPYVEDILVLHNAGKTNDEIAQQFNHIGLNSLEIAKIIAGELPKEPVREDEIK